MFYCVINPKYTRKLTVTPLCGILSVFFSTNKILQTKFGKHYTKVFLISLYVH